MQISIVPEAFDPQAQIAMFAAGRADAGAIVAMAQAEGLEGHARSVKVRE